MPDNDQNRRSVRTADGNKGPVCPKARLEVFGLEMIEKTVRHGGASGRVYLPSDWIDKKVKIIRID